MSHLYENHLISKNQHGFVKQKSCLTNLLETLDIVTASLHSKQPLDIIYLDFAKAFDKVPHNRLLLKLDSYGIKGKIAHWIRDFLAERSQRVVLGSSQSDWSPVTSGVPQGSVLGPTLFIIYINDIVDNLNNFCNIYADDSKIIGKPGMNIQADLEKIEDWSKKWLMQLNTEKCKVMHIGKNNPNFNYFLQNHLTLQKQSISTTTDERDLGIYISKNLKFKHQVDHAAGKASSVVAMLRNTFVSRDPFLWKKLYTTYVRPHLEFAIQAWNPYQNGDINTLEKIQRMATKVGCLKRKSYDERRRILGLTTLEQRRIRGDLILKYKLEKGLDLINWQNPPLVSEERASRRPQHRREIVKNCAPRFNFFNNRVAAFWNNLPDEIVNAKSLNSFKAKIDANYDCYRASSSVDPLRGV